MSRYYEEVPVLGDRKMIEEAAGGYLQKEGFQTLGEDGLWGKLYSITGGPHFIHLTIGEGRVAVQAWIKIALLPRLWIGEMGIKGMYGFLAKRQMRRRLEELKKVMKGV